MEHWKRFEKEKHLNEYLKKNNLTSIHTVGSSHSTPNLCILMKILFPLLWGNYVKQSLELTTIIPHEWLLTTRPSSTLATNFWCDLFPSRALKSLRSSNNIFALAVTNRKSLKLHCCYKKIKHINASFSPS